MKLIRIIIALFVVTFGCVVGCNAEWITIDTYAYTSPYPGAITASGHIPFVGGVACNLAPLGTRILIDGNWYVINDRSGTPNIVDIYFDTYEECIEYGIQTKRVFIER